MKVLLVHSYLHDSGGDTLYTLRLAELLRSKGHIVELWSMKHYNNRPHTYEKYGAETIDFKKLSQNKTLQNALRVLIGAIYSFDAKKKIRYVLDHFKPDLVHLQSIHYTLTTSIIDEIYAHRIPIIWTQHNFSIVCCNYLYSNGQICEACKPNRFYSPIIKKCKKNSRSASTIGAFQLYFDYWRNVYSKVDRFVVLTDFFKNKLAEFNFDQRKIAIVPNFYIPQNSSDPIIERNYILYFGNLNKWKGVEVLISAVRKNENRMQLVIVGDGKQKEELIFLASDDSRIRFIGHKSQKELFPILLKSKFVIVPSILFDNFPNAILEAYGCEKPVIGSAIGGITEMIVDGVTGLLFKPGDADDLSSKIDQLWNDDALVQKMGKAAKLRLDNLYNADQHYYSLMKIYNEAMNENEIH